MQRRNSKVSCLGGAVSPGQWAAGFSVTRTCSLLRLGQVEDAEASIQQG